MTGFLILVALLHGYVGMRLVPDLPGGPLAQGLLVAWLVFSAVTMRYAFSARRGATRFTDVAAWAGGLAMGAFSTLFVLTVLRDLGLALADAAGLAWPALAPGAAVRASTAAAIPLAAVALTAAGIASARRRAPVRDVDVPIRGLPAALHGFTIAQVTDVHVGPTIKRGYVDAIVDAVNALQADMVALTGDLVDGAVGDLAPHTAPFARLSARHGSFFVTGNHEYYSGAHAWIAEMSRLGVTPLVNEHVVLEHEGAHVVVAGVTDYGAVAFDRTHASDPAGALHGAPAKAAVRLLLAHQPRSAFAAAEAGYDLQLSGHTHGGQFVPWNFLVRLQQPFTAGLRRLGGLWVYTSRGTGYWGPPMRLGAPSEITRLRLVPA
ncbi:MAG: metallophosphoesterase [Proteobacteria bacterium]|nr:metallophosphoesterase [Pseudomonadota bacterium]